MPWLMVCLPVWSPAGLPLPATLACLLCLPCLRRHTTMRIRFLDCIKEYGVIAAHARQGEVMLCRLPHQLERDWLSRFEKQQQDIRAYLNSVGKADESLLSREQQQQLAGLLGAGRYQCHFDGTWVKFTHNSSNANAALNHIISVVPTGMVRLVDAMAAAKRRFEAAGGR